MAKKQSNSRPARWGRACDEARKAVDAVEAAIADLNAAREDLNDIKSEFQDWLDNLPENLRYNSALGEKLEAVCSLELDSDIEGPDVDWLDEAEGADLPLGFGRD